MNRWCKKIVPALAALCTAVLPLAAQDEEDFESLFDQEIPEVAQENLQRTFTIITSDHPFDLNPHTAAYSIEAEFLTGLYEGLYSYDPKTLDPIPALAETYKISRNKKRWTFTIREGARFSDDSPITAASVRASWISLLRHPNAPYASLLDCIEGAEAFRTGKIGEEGLGIIARDERTLVVNLNTPTAHLPRILCHHAFSCVSEKEGVYSGAFVLKGILDGSYQFERNPHYWDLEHVALPFIIVLQSDKATENAFLYNVGMADWIVSMVDTNVLLSKRSVRIAAEFGTEYIFFTCRNKPWDNALLRNALLSAVPWEQLRSGNLVSAQTLVYPLTGYPQVEGISDFSLEDALDMMKDARKELGLSPDEKIELTYGISNRSERQKKQYELLKEAWEPLGVELKVQQTRDEDYLSSMPFWNADLFLYSWIGDFADPTAFLELFRYGSTLNLTSWKNEEFERLLKEAGNTSDTSEHYKLLSKAEQVLLDDGLILPISHPVSLHAIDPVTVGGWYPNALDIHPLKYIFLKEDTTPPVGNIVKK